MNSIKKMITFVILAVNIHILQAEHKDSIYVVNHYGEEVVVNLVWAPKPNALAYFNQSKEFSVYADDFYNDELDDKQFNLRFQHKAPYSGYYLQEIVVASATDKAMSYQQEVSSYNAPKSYSSYTPPSNTANNIAEARYKFTRPLSNNLFFVIEIDEQKSMYSGRKQIKLTRYLSKEDYRRELAEKHPHLIKKALQSQQPASILVQPVALQNEYIKASNNHYQSEIAENQYNENVYVSRFGS